MATHIKDIINDFFEKKNQNIKKYNIVEGKIKKVLDKETQKHIQIKKISEKEVIVLSDSSSATYNFNLIKKVLLEEIKSEMPGVENIKVRVN